MSGQETPDLVEMAVEYVVSAVPIDEMDSDMFAIRVQWRGDGDRWSVNLRSSVLTRGGEWVYEPIPSSRTKAFLKRTRFDLQTALKLARLEAPKVRVNGMTVDAFRAMVEQRRAEASHG